MKIREGMLITPEEYVAENLWGRTREAAVKKVEDKGASFVVIVAVKF